MLASLLTMIEALPIAAVAGVFAAGAISILWAGSRLPVIGRRIAPGLGLAETAVGLFVLAVITSLPELSVTLSAMRVGSADLALGNVLGSNNFNLATAGFLSMFFGARLFSGIDSRRYVRIGLLLVASTVVTGAGIAFGPKIGGGVSVLVFSLPVFVLFVLESRTAGTADRANNTGGAVAGETDSEPTEGSTSGALVAFAALALVVIVAGVVVSLTAKRIAGYEFGAVGGALVLGETFVGTLLVAVATSLPEVTVAYYAISRAGSPDMAMGTLLGSNSFNLLVFALGAPLVLWWTTGARSGWSKLAEGGVLGPVHGVSPNFVNAALALVLTCLVLGALLAKRSRKILAALTVPLYVVGLYVVYLMR